MLQQPPSDICSNCGLTIVSGRLVASKCFGRGKYLGSAESAEDVVVDVICTARVCWTKAVRSKAAPSRCDPK